MRNKKANSVADTTNVGFALVSQAGVSYEWYKKLTHVE